MSFVLAVCCTSVVTRRHRQGRTRQRRQFPPEWKSFAYLPTLDKKIKNSLI